MTRRLLQLYEKMTPREQKEFEAYAAFLLARRKLKKEKLMTDDIPAQELMKLVDQTGCFEWLDSETENGYSIDDGDSVQWPEPS